MFKNSSHDVKQIQDRLEVMNIKLDVFSEIVAKQEKLVHVRRIS